MKKFTIKVPYSETVYGCTTYQVEADSLEEARAMLLEEDYLYYHDSVRRGSDDYTQFWDDAEWKEEE